MTPLTPEEGLQVHISTTAFAGDVSGELPLWVAEVVAGEGPVLASLDFVQITSIRDDPTGDVSDIYGDESARAVGRILGTVDVEPGDCIVLDSHATSRREDLLRYAAIEVLRTLRAGCLHVDEVHARGWVKIPAGAESGTFHPPTGAEREITLSHLASSSVSRRGLRLIRSS